ncbi:acetyl-CoA hydrolase [Thermodesulfobacteriota bacterium]
MAVEYQPMRSLIYVDVVKEDYRHKLKHWLHRYHIADSISQFGPYVSKYAFYPALPTPPEGSRFGTVRMQLTEHYWMIHPFQNELKVKTFNEYFPLDVLKWQGTIPDTEEEPSTNIDGDAGRSSGGDNEMPPFIFAFVPVWWEEDFKGNERTVEDGPNYRWQFVLRYPEDVSVEQGDEWFYQEVIPQFQTMPEVTRILSSKILREVNSCPFHRVTEMWFDGPTDWHRAAVEKAASIKKPAWAKQDKFPYLQSRFEITSIFLTDIAEIDNMTQYNGYYTMR